LQQIGLTTLRLLEVCAAAGVFEDDRTPAVDRWLSDNHRRAAHADARRAAPLVHHHDPWQPHPPRSHPRSEKTARLYLRWSLPALQSWAAAGHTSLREIAPDDLAAVLPDSGAQRARMGQGLRGIFRVLKAHRIVFLNPLNGITTGTHPARHPMPVPAVALREALTSPDPARAALAALAAFHGMRSGELRGLQLTDIHTGRLHLNGRTIPLAEALLTFPWVDS